jgi:aspartyl-tRNA(Asn)/glutamyl-tRNA(Gln) amidotransferase subunit A
MVDYFNFRKNIIDNRTSIISEVNETLNRIKSSNLNSFITIAETEALQQAEISQVRFNNGNPRELEGMIIAVKDNISTNGIRTTCASKILNNYTPIYDATVVARMKTQGAIIIGKTNLDEFAMGSSNETSYFGPVLNPIDNEYVPGGSSGGSATSVTAELCHTALGSDTGGSIRQPAAFCGNIGFKPTYGRVSRYGLVAFASSLDQIGTFSRSIEDAALLYDVIAGKDEMDATTSGNRQANTIENLDKFDFKKFKIAVLDDDIINQCDDAIKENYFYNLDLLKKNGLQVEEIKFDNFDASIATYYIVATAEASSNLARFDGVRYGYRAELQQGDDLMVKTRSEGFGAEVKRRIMLGTYVLSSGYYDTYYGKALKARRLMYNQYKQMFSKFDLLFLPTTPSTAFKFGEKINDPISMYLSDMFTTSANLASIPAISVPSGKDSKGLPIGMQFQADTFEESKLLGFSKFFLELNK